ncbi:AraC family transcriptional regulator [Haloplasma contractile]|uniref:Transcriptional regulator protein n=1 Tax=Haloplasma contractile SSD-17B TaxID=1033810 RepID=U2FPV2_9MOLU|nr:helix-turn-helix domain-containing protein [Haloplasma contractile]ERJ13069.1 Transcriptional regulator protein [Haloplasma contractile SSD-17B]
MYFKINTGTLPKVTFIGHVKYQTKWKHFERISDEYILFIVNGGDLYIKEGETHYHLTKGDILVLEPEKRHIGYKASACDYYYIHFKIDDIEYEYKNDKELDNMIYHNKSPYFNDQKEFKDFYLYLPKHYSVKDLNSFYKIINDVEEGAEDYYNGNDFHAVLCATRLIEIFIRLYRLILNEKNNKFYKKVSKTFFTAQQVKKFIESNSYRQVTKEMVVEKFEFNYDYLNRLFKKYNGCSIQQYLQLKKIEKAKEILLNNDVKISVVAYLVGIDNPYYFSKLFKKYVGIPPLEFYKNARLDKKTKL